MIKFLLISMMLHIAASFFFIGGGLRVGKNEFAPIHFAALENYGPQIKNNLMPLKITLKNGILEKSSYGEFIEPSFQNLTESMGLPVIETAGLPRQARGRFNRRAFEPTIEDIKRNARCFQGNDLSNPNCGYPKPQP
jgi:hypothetical protein